MTANLPLEESDSCDIFKSIADSLPTGAGHRQRAGINQGVLFFGGFPGEPKIYLRGAVRPEADATETKEFCAPRVGPVVTQRRERLDLANALVRPDIARVHDAFDARIPREQA